MLHVNPKLVGMDVDKRTARIITVRDQSQAADHGVKVGWKIVGINSTNVDGERAKNELTQAMEEFGKFSATFAKYSSSDADEPAANVATVTLDFDASRLGIRFDTEEGSILEVRPKTMASNAGIQVGWRCIALNGESVRPSNVCEAVKERWRQGEAFTMSFRTAFPEGTGLVPTKNYVFEGNSPIGLELNTRTGAVLRVTKDSQAGRYGIQKGWTVVEVDGKAVSPANACQQVTSLKKEASFTICFRKSQAPSDAPQTPSSIEPPLDHPNKSSAAAAGTSTSGPQDWMLTDTAPTHYMVHCGQPSMILHGQFGQPRNIEAEVSSLTDNALLTPYQTPTPYRQPKCLGSPRGQLALQTRY